MAGLLIARNNAQLVKMEEVSEEEVKARELLDNSLAGHVLNVWESNKRAKLTIEQKMLRNLRQRVGRYESDKLTEIQKTRGSEIFIKLTEVKCKAAEAWVGDVYSPAYERDGFQIKPTPDPELPEYIVNSVRETVNDAAHNLAMNYIAQSGVSVSRHEYNEVVQKHLNYMQDKESKLLYKAAERASQKMFIKIKDQLHEGGYVSAFEDVRRDIITFGTGFLKGPVAKKKPGLKWMLTDAGYVPSITSEIAYEFSRVSPFDIYPSPTATTIEDDGLIERMRVRRKDISDLIGVGGYNEDNIRLVLQAYAGGHTEITPIDSERDYAEGREASATFDRDTIDILNYWGYVQGRKLLEYGMSETQIPDPDTDYAVNVQLVGQYVIKAVINHLRSTPYSMCVYTKIPGSFWGEGLVDELEDLQIVLNGISRAICNNAAMASGPQVVVDREKLRGGSAQTLVPWKIWVTDTEGMSGNNKPIEFYQPRSTITELLVAYDKFSAEADVKTGIPSIAHGGSRMGAGAGNTASGMSMYLEMAGKVIRELISRMDTNIAYTTINRMYNVNMLYSRDTSIKGDAKIVICGVNAMSLQEQQALRKQEFLNSTNNQTDIQITGLEGRRFVLRQAALAVGIDADQAVPLDRDMAKLQETVDAAVSTQTANPVQTQEPATLDVSGKPAGGTDVNMFKSVTKRG